MLCLAQCYRGVNSDIATPNMPIRQHPRPSKSTIVNYSRILCRHLRCSVCDRTPDTNCRVRCRSNGCKNCSIANGPYPTWLGSNSTSGASSFRHIPFCPTNQDVINISFLRHLPNSYTKTEPPREQLFIGRPMPSFS